MKVLGIAEARASLSSIVGKLADDESDAVLLGSHRRPEAAIVPYALLTRLSESAPQRRLLERLQEKRDLVLRLATMSQITGVSVFGSVARGDDREDSDIDLLVDSAAGSSLNDLAQFELDMEALFDRPVSAVDRGGLDPLRDRTILAAAIAL